MSKAEWSLHDSDNVDCYTNVDKSFINLGFKVIKLSNPHLQQRQNYSFTSRRLREFYSERKN